MNRRDEGAADYLLVHACHRRHSSYIRQQINWHKILPPQSDLLDQLRRERIDLEPAPSPPPSPPPTGSRACEFVPIPHV